MVFHKRQDRSLSLAVIRGVHHAFTVCIMSCHDFCFAVVLYSMGLAHQKMKMRLDRKVNHTFTKRRTKTSF